MAAATATVLDSSRPADLSVTRSSRSGMWDRMDAWCLSCIGLVLHKVWTRKSNTVKWLSLPSMVKILSSNRLSIANFVAFFHCLFNSYIPKAHTAHLVHMAFDMLTELHISTHSLLCIYMLMLLHTCPFCDKSGQMLHHNQTCAYHHCKFWQSPSKIVKN